VGGAECFNPRARMGRDSSRKTERLSSVADGGRANTGDYSVHGVMLRSSSTICTATALARAYPGNADHSGFAQDDCVSSHSAMTAAQPQ